MNDKTVNYRNIIIVLLFAVLIFSPCLASAALEVSYPVIPGADAPQVFMQKIKDGLINPSQALPLYVLYFYTLTIILSGVLAFGSIVYGVIRYLVSGGAVSQMIAAKEQIADAIIGLLIILSSYVIMTTIDPKMLIISKSPTVCAPVGDPDYDPLCGQPINYPGGYTVLMDYIEVPLGRLVESVIQRGWAAENAAYAVQLAAERLATLTKRLTTITNPPAGTTGCRCSDFSSSCRGDTCSGNCRQSDPCYNVRQELDCLLYKVVTCPPVSSTGPVNNFAQLPSAFASLTGDGVLTQTLAVPAASCARACGGEMEFWGLPAPAPGTYTFHPRMCVRPGGCPTCDGISHLKNWSVSDSTGANGFMSDTGGWQAQCGVGWLDFDFWGNSGYNPQPVMIGVGDSFTASVSWEKASSGLPDCCVDGGSASCRITLVQTGTGYAWSSTCGVPACTSSCGLVQDAIDALKAARCRASEAQIALAKELLKLKLAEGLLRDSQASPITYETFIAFEGENATIVPISIWDNVKLDEDPYDDPEDPYINEPDGTDPATFYVPKDGNEEIIELSKNAFFQFQPANGCGGLSGGGSPPAPCTASLINPFPAFYQYGPGTTVQPWQDSPIDTCTPINKIMNYGCGPTSLAMIVKHLTGQNVDPKIIADQLKGDGIEYVCGFGSTVTGLKRIATDYNLNSVEITASQISSHIAENHPVMTVCSTFFGRAVGHVTVIKGDNCSQFGFQDTVWGERWDDKATVQGTYGCNYFLAFCNASEEANCGITAPPPPPPPPPPPEGDPITTFTEKCLTKTNREGNEGLNPKYWTFSLVDEPKTIISKPTATPWPDLDPTGAFSPQLVGLLSRIPSIMRTYVKSSPTPTEQKWPVHQIGLATSPGESVKLPDADFPFSTTSMCCGYEAIVIYADSDSMTFNYDNFDGLSTATIYLTGISVNPKILDIYNNQTLKGCATDYYGDRVPFAALKPGALLGTAIGSELKVSTRGGSTWFDPRWQQLYWHGY